MDEQIGLYTFEFVAIDMHAELLLSVEIYSYDLAAKTYSYKHIP